MFRLLTTAFLGMLTILASCDFDPFGSDAREIAAGYSLVRADDKDAFFVRTPGGSGGALCNEIGWQKPYIVSRERASQKWRLLSTDTHDDSVILDSDRQKAPYGQFKPMAATEAWRVLKSGRRWR